MSLHFCRPMVSLRGLGAVAIIGLFLPIMAGASPAAAGEWPQILGPGRNAVAAQEKLADSWPAAGPQVIWQREVGAGYSGVAVAAGQAIVFHRLAGEAICEAFDAATGKPLWKTAFPTKYASGIAPDNGPRCVPVVHKDFVYLLGAESDLHCLAMVDGRKVWSRLLARELNIPDSYFGAGSTPVVAGDKLLVNVGARGGAGIVAFALTDGKTIWKATDEGASYSSPTIATIDGEATAIFATRLNAVGIDPANGEVRFRFPFGQRGPTVNAATPLVLGDHLFLTASYGIGAVWAKLSRGAADEVWASDEIMSSQYTTCAEADGYLYGIDGRQDGGTCRLRAIEPKTRKIAWTVDDFGTGNLILADGKLVVMKTAGELVLARAAPAKFEQLAAAKIFEMTVQPLPALAGGLLYVRDTRTLKCLDLRPTMR